MFIYCDLYSVEVTGADILDFFIASLSLSLSHSSALYAPDIWGKLVIGSRTHHRYQNMKMLKSFNQPSVSASSATWNPTKHEAQS